MNYKVLNQLEKRQAEKRIKTILIGILKNFFKILLELDDAIKAVYYSTGKIILEERRYKN
ncbi:hypothetical protein [Candidatus Williamhamiltonella defendens]|uniref:hypothetical protein n=1 Tax=Candidatus Williamhamiltonella defendens TaxID=138072 RepID=UPI0016519FF3|nr:hypothetical protein [Candidatus Hamiltonella defensa]